MSAAPAHDRVALTVVRFLGAASLVGLLAASLLCYTALRYEGNDNGGVVIAIVGNLASAALAALGSILASTGKGAPTPVTVENQPTDPIPTTDTAPAPAIDPHPDAPEESDL